MICSVRNIGNHYKSTSIVRNQEKSAEHTVNQQKTLEIFGNRRNSLELKKSFPLQIAAWIWFAKILYRVLMSCTDSRCFLDSLEMILLDSRRFVGILLIFRNLDEFEWSIWFTFEFGVIQISCYPHGVLSLLLYNENQMDHKWMVFSKDWWFGVYVQCLLCSYQKAKRKNQN